MDKIQFLNSSNIYDVNLIRNGKAVKIVFTEKSMPNNLTAGFKLLNENNGNVMGDYSAYKTVYRTYEAGSYTVELSNDGSVYTEPDGIVTFTASEGGAVEGELSQTAKDYSDISVPATVAETGYAFARWTPELPESGAVVGNVSFEAVFELTENGSKIKELEAEKESLLSQIEKKKFEIASTDYIIIKVSELEFIGETQDEYNMDEIHSSRQAIRDEINVLSAKVDEIDAGIAELSK